jgi:hypothetical protein
MPIAWSPVKPDVLFYTSNVVWKSTDHAHSWTRISPDLARQSWQVPASAGKYASTVTPAPQGSITAMALSPRDVNVIWTGTDDGAIQVTTDGGVRWTNVTPPQIKPWTRIFNMDAGHFDSRTAYAAANTLRIDDMHPHFWRTHDGGRTWTEINTGIAPNAVANSIREDPRVRGLLYAATDAQVWVSYDDGDHWQSLRLNMPAISVRDLEVKDDSSCLCSDLIAGTHGRGYWILDDVTPLRQMAEARSARAAYLFKPATAVRVRFATNDPTPWPPEVPAGENPPPGGIIDYWLASDASGPVTIDILDGAGKMVRTYSSTNRAPDPDPALDPVAYNRLCQRDPSAPDCSLPLYWPAPAMRVSTRAGVHRVSWDLRYAPLTDASGAPVSDDDATGAVPHRTYPSVNAPWAPPGSYTVRLTANGVTSTQPLVLRLDPRVKTSPAALARVARLSRELYDGAVAAHAASARARALASRVDSLSGNDVAALRARLDSLVAAPTAGRGGRRRAAGAGSASTTTLDAVSTAMLDAAMAMQAADVEPTAGQLAAADKARAQYAEVMGRWTRVEADAARAAKAEPQRQ